VLLERTPYDKRRPVLHLAGQYFARRGYVVVMQDVRGRHGSQGEWYFLTEKEGPDGFDTLAWIEKQPFCDGGIGTMGLSYSTATQQALAVLHPPALKAQFLGDGGYSYFHRTLRHSGAFELGVLLPYAFRMAREGREVYRDKATRAEFFAAWDDLRPWVRTKPLARGETPLRLSPSDERYFFDMLETSDYTDYWKQPTLSMQEHIDRYPDLPVLAQTSWYGHHVWATTEKWHELRRRGPAPKTLLIGHWLHGYDEYARSFAGDVDFGEASMLDVDDLRLRFFDRWLKGLATGVDEEAPVRIFVMGGGSGRQNRDLRLQHGGRWRDEREWPLARTAFTRFFLHGGGALRREAPPAGAPPSVFRFDPDDPAPTIGGNVQDPFFPRLIRGGAFDQRGRAELWVCRDRRPLRERPDVRVFETEPLAEDVEITGPITVKLWASSSATDTDFTAKLVDVYPPSEDYPDGFAMNLSDSIARARFRNGFARPEWLRPGEVFELTIEPQPTSNLWKSGHRIRIDLSSSNFPHFDVNPHPAENAVYHDASRPSHLVLPIVPR
jgi:putative CocE/NonD family hydrolase